MGDAEDAAFQRPLTAGQLHAETLLEPIQKGLAVDPLGEVDGGHALGGPGGDESQPKGLDSRPGGPGQAPSPGPISLRSPAARISRRLSASALTSGMAGV